MGVYGRKEIRPFACDFSVSSLSDYLPPVDFRKQFLRVGSHRAFCDMKQRPQQFHYAPVLFHAGIVSVQCQRIVVLPVVAIFKRRIHFANQLAEIILQFLYAIHSLPCGYCIEAVPFGQHLPYLLAELPPHFVSPRCLLRLPIAGIERHHEEEVDVVARKQHRVAVEQTVFELERDFGILPSIGHRSRHNFTMRIAIVTSFHFGADEEVGDDVVALRHLVAQPHLGIGFLVVHPQVDVVLHDVAGIGVLLVDGGVAQRAPYLVVFRVADIVGALLLVGLYQSRPGVEVVDQLAVFLLLEVGRQVLFAVAYQLVDDGFEYHIEVLHQQVFLQLGAGGDLRAVGEEGIAEVPQLQHLVGEVFVLDLPQAYHPASV